MSRFRPGEIKKANLFLHRRKAEASSNEEEDDGKLKPKTAAQRKELLEADAYILAVQPHDVQCRKCEKWIHLSNSQEYADGNWNIHRKSCCEAMYVHCHDIPGSSLIVFSLAQATALLLPQGSYKS